MQLGQFELISKDFGYFSRVAQAIWKVAQAIWERLHRLYGGLHRLYGQVAQAIWRFF